MPITDCDHALVRALPRSYASSYASRGICVDIRLADAQHAAYAGALQQAGVSISVVSADEAFYDCVFIEDTVVVWHDRALVTRMTAHREGEQRAVADALRSTHLLAELPRDARLEGGDVLHTEDMTYVGLTERTNEQGVRALADFLAPFNRPVVPVGVSGALHLKSVATYLGNATVLVAPGHVDARVFDVQEIITTAWCESGSANCVRVGDTLIARQGFPATLAKLEAFAKQCSARLVPLDLSEFEKGDGSATCLSVLWHGGPAATAARVA